MAHQGSCLCGRVRYALDGEFLFSGHCHCSICRRAHGAAYVTWGIIDPDQFRWTGGEEFLGVYESSAGRYRCFCTHCSSPLVSRHGDQVGEIALASVHGDPDTRPREHIFTGSKAAWHEITDSLPQYETWPTDREP